MRYQYLLFDLDGTLFNTSRGIMRSAAYALEKLGEPVLSETALRRFIGPPLVDAFMSECGFSLARAKEATAAYRERYSVKGLLEVEPYAGIPELLAALKAAGVTMAVATGKPALFSRQILENHGLWGYFSTMVTPEMDGRRSEKCEIITCILDELGIGKADYPRVAMIGDRCFDIEGAKQVGVASIGVRYGFAGEGELESLCPDHLVNSVAALSALLLGEDA